MLPRETREFARAAAAPISVLLALWLTRVLGLQVTGGVSPLFFAAVMFSAYVGGLWGGLVATALASLATAYFFQMPHDRLVLGWDDAVRLAVFMAVALLISSLQYANQRALQRLASARSEAETAQRIAIAANFAKDRFLNILGHELRNPLTPIISIVTLRLKQLEGQSLAGLDDPLDHESLRDDFEMIRRNAHVEARLIDDLLESRRIHTGKLRLIRQREDLSAIVAQAVEAARFPAEAKGLTLRFRCARRADGELAVPIVNGDATRLRQICWNLLNNATKFTAHGAIRVTLRPASRGSAATLSVADTGPGMTPDSVRAVFRPFVQLTDASGRTADSRAIAGGLGLGLSIVDALVRAHGGDVRVRAVLGRGSVFRVRLPVEWLAPTDVPPVLRGATGRDGRSDRAGLRVLIVDDHADTPRILSRLLTLEGHQVARAASVAEAMAKAETASFDLLISDIGLGDGTGHELMERLREKHGLPGIAISGFATADDFARSRASGFAYHLVKPVPFEVLSDHVNRFR